MPPTVIAFSGDRHRTAHNAVNNDTFFAAEYAAQAAAESTIDELYRRAAQERNASVAIATVAFAAASVAAVAAWKSPFGVKIRKKVAIAIAPKLTEL